jgi:hypothetical protein
MSLFKPLEELVREELIERGELNEAKFARFYQLGVSCLRNEINYSVNGYHKGVSLTINDNDTVNLPPDYIDYKTLAVCGKDGKLHPLGHRSNGCYLKTGDCGNLEKDPGINVSDGILGLGYGGIVGGGVSSGYSNHVKDGSFVGRFYGLGGGNNANGYYRFFEDEGYIALYNFPYKAQTDQIFLEYLADIRQVGGDYVVHAYDEEAVKAWLWWKSIQKSKAYGENKILSARREYYNQKRLARLKHNSSTVQEFAEALRTNNKLSPKF